MRLQRGIIATMKSPGGGMADATDLKSVSRKGVKVRVLSRAPVNFLILLRRLEIYEIAFS